MGKRGNQTFVSIPHARFIAMLTYKAQLVGIRVTTIEEAYTSKCSFLDREPIRKHPTYLGQRIERGLFRASDGRTLQADLNAAYNLIRKVAADAFDRSYAVATHGRRVSPQTMQKHLQMWEHDEAVGRIPREAVRSVPGETVNLRT